MQCHLLRNQIYLLAVRFRSNTVPRKSRKISESFSEIKIALKSTKSSMRFYGTLKKLNELSKIF